MMLCLKTQTVCFLTLLLCSAYHNVHLWGGACAFSSVIVHLCIGIYIQTPALPIICSCPPALLPCAAILLKNHAMSAHA